MDLIDRDQLLLMIDRVDAECKRRHVILTCENFRHIVNKMPSVAPDEPWETNTNALTELIMKE